MASDSCRWLSSAAGSSAASAQRLPRRRRSRGRRQPAARRRPARRRRPRPSRRRPRRSRCAGRRAARRCRPRRAARSGRRSSVPQSWSGSCQGRPRGRAPARARPVLGSARASTCGWTRGSIHGARCRTYSGCTVSRARSVEAGRGRGGPQVGQVRPRPLGVDVVGGHRRHPAPVVDAGGAAAGRSPSSDRLGGACSRTAGAEHDPRGRQRRQVLLVVQVGDRAASRWRPWPGSSGRSPPARARAGEPSCAAPAASRRARATVSPMPTRSPVVNGMRQPAGVLQHAQAHRRVLVRRPEVRPGRLGRTAASTSSRASSPSTARPA